jgi:hypothetical protein
MIGEDDKSCVVPYKPPQNHRCQFGDRERNDLLCIAEVITAGLWALRFHQATSSPGDRGLYWLHGPFAITAIK